jgi:nucleotide-binding universal stress UspA family protein
VLAESNGTESLVIRNILVPTDFSAGAQAAVSHARDLAAEVGAALHLLHVVENPFAPGGFMESYPHPPGYYPVDLENHARLHLDGCLSADDKVRFRAVLTVMTGIPAVEILQRAHGSPAVDLVVIATHGRGGAARLTVGSVADKVIRGAVCPVLTVRP